MEYLSHKERYLHAVRKSCILFKKVSEWQERNDSGSNSMEVYKYEQTIMFMTNTYFVICDVISDHFWADKLVVR